MAFWSNCYIEARIEYWVRRRRWRRDPTLPIPYLVKRPSLASSLIEHYFVGTFDESIDAVRISSFKPERPRKRLALWQLPIALMFPGKWVRGDTQAMPLDDPADTKPPAA